jgi:hypothetical protein
VRRRRELDSVGVDGRAFERVAKPVGTGVNPLAVPLCAGWSPQWLETEWLEVVNDNYSFQLESSNCHWPRKREAGPTLHPEKTRLYRSATHMITMVYFVAGKLRFPQF